MGGAKFFASQRTWVWLIDFHSGCRRELCSHLFVSERELPFLHFSRADTVG